MEPVAPREPVITVVLIAFDDEHNLPAAVASARAQTFEDIEILIVDDASTDGTGALADRYATEDERIRVIHHGTNSGGCSGPRNTGIDAARGEWVMFLDSDDELTPGACAVLLEAARRHDADVVSGAMVRVDVGSGRERRKFGWIYDRERVFGGLREWPDLLFDVMVQDKIFRKALLDEHRIRFPAGLIYEDMDFTTRALARARVAVVIPDIVYRYLQRDPAEHAAITSRTDVAAFEDRLTIQRMIDRFLADEGLPDAKVVKDVRFLQYDLRDQLSGLPEADADARQRVVAMARDYLDELDPAAFRKVRPAQRATASLVRRGAIGALVALVRARRAGSRVVRAGIAVLPDRAASRLGAPVGSGAGARYAPPPNAGTARGA